MLNIAKYFDPREEGKEECSSKTAPIYCLQIVSRSPHRVERLI
jgi:hypothetical protein